MPSHDPKYSSELISALNELESLHDAAGSQAHQNYYLKLALLELCGWVEQTQDVVLSRLAGYWLSVEKPDFDDRLKRNFGFTYDRNFRTLLQGLIGLRGVEMIESRIAEHLDANVARVCAEMISFLNDTLKLPRNTHAHTFAGVQNQPLQHLLHFTVLRRAATTIDVGLQMIETEVCRC